MDMPCYTVKANEDPFWWTYRPTYVRTYRWKRSTAFIIESSALRLYPYEIRAQYEVVFGLVSNRKYVRTEARLTDVVSLLLI